MFEEEEEEKNMIKIYSRSSSNIREMDFKDLVKDLEMTFPDKDIVKEMAFAEKDLEMAFAEMTNPRKSRKSLLEMKFDKSNGLLIDHFRKFDRYIRNLRSTEATLEETDIICYLLLTMPPKYNSVISRIKNSASNNLRLEFVKNRLLDFETEMKKKDRLDSMSNRTLGKFFTFNAIPFILDSGATSHMVNDLYHESLKNVKELEKPVKIKVGKTGVFLQANAIGELHVSISVKGKEVIEIIKILVVPDLEQRGILSVQKLEMNGYQVIFKNGKGLLKKDNKTVARARMNSEGLYQLGIKLSEDHKLEVSKEVCFFKCKHKTEQIRIMAYENKIN